jgi:hypothetical protein
VRGSGQTANPLSGRRALDISLVPIFWRGGSKRCPGKNRRPLLGWSSWSRFRLAKKRAISLLLLRRADGRQIQAVRLCGWSPVLSWATATHLSKSVPPPQKVRREISTEKKYSLALELGPSRG